MKKPPTRCPSSISSGLPNSHSWSTQGHGSHSRNAKTSLGSRSGPNKNPRISVGWVINPTSMGWVITPQWNPVYFRPIFRGPVPMVEGVVPRSWLLRLRGDEFQRVFWRVFRCTGCVSWWFLFSKTLMGSRVTFFWSIQTSDTICLRGKSFQNYHTSLYCLIHPKCEI